MRRSLLLLATAIVMTAPCAAFGKDRAPHLIAKPKRVFKTMPPIEISPGLATKVGRQVWRNETGGNRDAITAWNATEDFASVGIGHFIWFPAGLETRFKEAFPTMLNYLRSRGAKPPAWLDKSPVPACPWKTRREFLREFRSAKMRGLRSFLLDTVGLQAEYLALRMQKALPIILDSLTDAEERDHGRDQFYRVVAASPDLYPLIDYVNFKGEGISASETFPNRKTGEPEGWGLTQVLLAMQGTSPERDDVLGDFADGARFALLRRIANNPPDRRWQRGWMKRVETYRRPLR